MPDPIPYSGPINADLIRTNWSIDGQFSISGFRNLQVWDDSANPNNSNKPYGVRNLPSSPIRFSDFRGKLEMYPIDYCIIGGGGGGGGGAILRAGGGGGGGRVINGTIYLPNYNNDSSGKGWNRIFVYVGAGGVGAPNGQSLPGGGFGSSIQYYYTTPSSTGGEEVTNFILSRGGGAGAGAVNLSTSEGCGGGGAADANLNGTNYDPGFGDATRGGYASTRRVTSTADSKGMAGGGGGAGSNGYDGYTSNTFNNSKAGKGGLPAELSNFLGSSPLSGNPFGAENRAGGGGGGGGWSQNEDQNIFRAEAQLGGGGQGATTGATTDQQYKATDGKIYRGGGGGGGSQPDGGKAGNGGSGSVILRYRNINNVQKGSGGTVYNININGISYYTHIFFSTGSFDFYS